MEDVRHINMTDANEQVYCHKMGDVAAFDGVHVATQCWNCPLWGGLAGGYGVECVFDDPNASAQEVKFTKATAAKAEAPEVPEDLASISSANGLASFQARSKMTTADNADAEAGDEATTPTDSGDPTKKVAESATTPAEDEEPAAEEPTDEAPSLDEAAAATEEEEPAPVEEKKKKAPPIPKSFRQVQVEAIAKAIRMSQ